MTRPVITPLPAFPVRGEDPAVFAVKANNTVAAYPTFVTESNAVAAFTESEADAAQASSVAAAAEVVLATAQAGIATAAAGDSLSYSALSAGSANLKGAWDDQSGAAVKPYSVTHTNRIWVLINNLANVALSEPGITADWFSIGTIAFQERSTNIILSPDDYGSNIKYTGAGGFTQTFESISLMVSGWYVYLKNTTTGNITLDPSGAETIDGLTSFIMYPNEYRLVQLNAAGTALESTVINSFEVTFDSTGTFIKPPGYIAFEGVVWSAGSSGQRTNSATTASRGGAGGGSFPFVIPSFTFSSSEIVTIGAGGAAVTTVANGNAGGNSSIGSLLTVITSQWNVGGAINNAADNSSGNIASFAGSGISVNANTIYGGAGTSSAGDASGNSIYGGAGGGSLTNLATLGAAGVSSFGGNGGAASSASNGLAGAQPAGGGGATQTGTQSGAGGDGRIVIRGVL